MEEDVVLFVLGGKDAPFPHQFADEGILALRDAEAHRRAQLGDLLLHPLEEFVEPCPLQRGDGHGLGVFEAELVEEERIFALVRFIEDGDDGAVRGVQLGEDFHRLFGLALGHGVAHIDEVEEDVGVDGLFEGAFEGGDEGVGDFTDEARRCRRGGSLGGWGG